MSESKKNTVQPLTPPLGVVSCTQQSHQASDRKVMLNIGGFLFFRPRGGAL
jgi:hypothetical protein